MTKAVALYARVSSEKQAQTKTIVSQVEELKARIMSDELTLLEEYQFIDDGYSGSNLVRPALEKLRDQAAAGSIDRIYIHSPDRLSRKYAYQMLLKEEFEKFGVEIVFLNFQSNNNPESNLLLQMQGMIAEYERSKILERNRRGRLHTAKRGSVNILSRAPYGYRYIEKHVNGGEAAFEIIEDEAEIVRKIFNWIGRERLTMMQVSKNLRKENIISKTKKDYWHRGTIYYMLKNPAYKGQAAFGKKIVIPRIPSLRTRKNSSDYPKNNYSTQNAKKENWIYITVPAIIDENLFDAVQEQLIENQKRARVNPQGVTYLLQGLLVCKCGRAYCGGKYVKRAINMEDIIYSYYRCTGIEKSRYGGIRMCNDSKKIDSKAIELIVWEEVKKLLNDPQRIFNEYQRRLNEIDKSPLDQSYESIERQKVKLEKGISLLIDSYTNQHIIKEEFEPRIKSMRQNLKIIQEQQQKLIEQKNSAKEMELIVNNLKNFASGIESTLNNLNWLEKRDIIRMVVKRIEIAEKEINIVYKVDKLFSGSKDVVNNNMQHCRNRITHPCPPPRPCS